MVLFTAAIVTAQADSVLAIQRAQDRRGRDALVRHLAAIRVDVNFDAITAPELARYLAAAAGGGVNVFVAAKDASEPFSLRLKRAPLTTVMEIAQRFGKLRFVYRAGAILIEHPDSVREYTYLRLYDVRAATAVIPSRPGPKLGLTQPGGEDEYGAGEGEGTPAGGFTIDKLEDLIRNHVLPESWDHRGVSLTSSRGVLWVRQTETGHREVAALLRQLGAIPQPRRAVTGRGRVRAARRPAPSPARFAAPRTRTAR